jgi:uncharacterized protein (UPF0305 family)
MESEMFSISADELYEMRKEKIKQEQKIKELEEELKNAMELIEKMKTEYNF